MTSSAPRNGGSPGSATLTSPIQTLSEAQGTLDGLIAQLGDYNHGRGTEPDWKNFQGQMKSVREQIVQAMQNWSSTSSGGKT